MSDTDIEPRQGEALKSACALHSHESTYGAQAMRGQMWQCECCTRSFSVRRLHMLRLRHRDGDCANNRSDGSNWQLICIACSGQTEHVAMPPINSVSMAVEMCSSTIIPATGSPVADLILLLEGRHRV